MKGPLRTAGNLVSLIAFATLLLLPGSKHEALEAIDPSFAAGDFEDAGGNRLVIVGLLLGLVLGPQLLLLARASEMRQRVVAAMFVAVAIIVCVTKFKQ
jgi:hypothetical protein